MKTLKILFRQPISGLTHLFAALAAIVGCIWSIYLLLINHLSTFCDWFSILLFFATMIFLYFSSSIYHLLHVSEKTIARLRKLDHSAIFLFIAGNFTPVCIILIPSQKSLFICEAVWLVAIIGVIIKIFWQESSRWLRVTPYFTMGMMSLLLIPDFYHHLAIGTLYWFLGGGLIYCIGALIYILKWPDPLPDHFGFHEIWHFFVMGGSFCHFWMIHEYLNHMHA